MGGRRAALLALLCAAVVTAPPPPPQPPPPRYSSRIVSTRAGAVRGLILEVSARRLEPVEAFLGVPYAGRPQRLRAPPELARWSGTRLADAPGPACPQLVPDVTNRSAALAHMPLGAYNELVAAAPLLEAQSEDCLHLNLYVPGSGARGVDAPYAVLVWTGGASLAWGAAGTVDGAALAARGRLLVVTPNTRVGLLGYLTAGGRDPVTRAGGAAVLDLLAALRWLQTHAAQFGGDPRRVTLVGARAAAGLAGALLALPEARGVLQRVVLLSGSPLAPAAVSPDVAVLRDHVSRALRCDPTPPADPDDHWLLSCVRARPLVALVRVQPPRPRFLSSWAPSPPPLSRALHASDAFLQCDLAVVVCTTESYHYFSEDEIRHGFEEEHRRRVLRTFVHNVFRWHRNEILAAVRNEYTDWERPIQHPINIRDATLEALSDGAVVAPALLVARQHARRGATTYVAHFAHQPRNVERPPRLGSVHGDADRYFLGLPLLETATGGGNVSRADAAAADAAVALLAAYCKGAVPPALWPRYSLGSQQYVSVGARSRTRSHYRGHRLALWLALLPQLHRPDTATLDHHRLRADSPDMFAGELVQEEEQSTTAKEENEEEEEGAQRAVEAAEECAPPPAPAARPALPAPLTTATTPVDTAAYSGGVSLTVAVCCGCLLLALNALVLVVLYARPAPRAAPRRRAPPAAPSPPAAAPPPLSPAAPRKSTLKRSSEPAAALSGARHTKRVHINEISV